MFFDHFKNIVSVTIFMIMITILIMIIFQADYDLLQRELENSKESSENKDMRIILREKTTGVS